MKIELIVTDSEVDLALAEIIKGAKTGRIGVGKIFVSPMDDAVRICTGEVGEATI